ncbi:low temperature requirement protein A [Micromonospora profundi]|uniref:Low temperature requirement protein A n=2 Tax=Micromonospora profundi TaxID=1420889 RepID=A0AAJ6HLF2_9ACTN|nr:MULTISPECIES: low temperature requirement protein A [Micromonospora]NJC11128.1 low temperature requirement protein LtrA [Micromonospora profundi]WLS42965.1 low temperature requirement protein A [Micromonospora profundi]
MDVGAGARGVQRSAPGSRATHLELFYDLIFVFAFLNVTTVTAENPTVRGLVQCLVVLALLWWCWTGFAVLGNLIRTDQGIVPLIGFATMAAAFVLALSLPKAFVDRSGGLYGPLVFAAGYFLVRVSETSIFIWLGRRNQDVRQRWLLLVLPPLLATSLIVAAALLPQRLFDGAGEGSARLVLWLAALGVEYGAGLLLGGSGWTVVSAGHWAERHGQIVLIALGEAIIALGFSPGGGAGLPLTWPALIAAVLGVAVAATLWWAYFDTLALGMEQALHRTRDPVARATLARDTYTYLHLPVIAGIILFALGLKGLIHEAADPNTPSWGVPLPSFDLLALYGGVALYLLALAVLGRRMLASRRWPTIGGIALLFVLVPVAGSLPEMVALAVLAVATSLAVLAQTIVDAHHRRGVRRVALAEQLAAEEEQSRWRRHHL